MKRILLSILLLAAMVVNVLALTACNLFGGATDFESISDDPVVYDGSPVTIKFSHTMGADLRDVLDDAIVAFNEIYPNIKIEHTQVGGYPDVLSDNRTKLTAGNQPNITYCYADHVATYNLTKAVLTLDKFIASTETFTRPDGKTEVLGLTEAQISDFIKGYYDEGKSFGDGKMYTLPMSKSTEVLYYNKTFFEENGLEVPTTWEEMEALCARIKEIDPACVPLGYDSEANWFITLCEQYGAPYTSATGENFLFDNEIAHEFTAMIRDWHQKGYVTTQEIYGSYTSALFTAKEGRRCYMCIGSSAGAKNQKPPQDDNSQYMFEADIAPIPQVNPADPKVISQGPSLCIFKDENPQEMAASWLFVKYLTTDVIFQASFSSVSGYVPVIKSVKENENYNKFLDRANGQGGLTALSVKKCLEQESAYFTSPAFRGSSEAREQVGILLQNIMLIPAGSDVQAEIEKYFDKAVSDAKYKSGQTSK